MADLPPLPQGSYEAKCICGACVVRAKNVAFAVYCHCSQCRRTLTCDYASLVGFKPDDLQVVAGEKHMTEYKTGREYRYSCNTCGSKVWANLTHLNHKAIYLTQFTTPNHGPDGKVSAPFQPTAHIFYTSGIVRCHDNLPKFVTLPSAFGGKDNDKRTDSDYNDLSAPHITLHYWGIRARSWPIMAAAAVGGVPINWVREPKWPEMKPNTPFGQLPVVDVEEADGKTTYRVGQSHAIVNFLARRGNLLGNEREFITGQMLLAEMEDIYSVIAKAQYAEDKKTAWAAVRNEKLPVHFANLEKMLAKDQLSFTGRALLGEALIWCILDIVVRDVDKDALAKFPGLAKFYEGMCKHEGIAKMLKEYADVGGYFKSE